MLQVEAKLSAKDLEYAYLQLAYYVRGGAGVDLDAEAIMSLRKQHKPESGMLYRGLTVDSATAIKILNNKKIALKRKRFPLISWSNKRSLASGFAGQSKLDKMDFAIVLAVNVPMNDRVLDVHSKDVINATQKAILESGKFARQYIMRVGNLMGREGEVLVKYNPNRKYTLCKNINIVLVHSHIFHKRRGQKDLAAAIMARLDYDTKDTVSELSTRDVNLSFDCKDGDLKLNEIKW